MSGRLRHRRSSSSPTACEKDKSDESPGTPQRQTAAGEDGNLERLQQGDGLHEGLVHPPLLCVVFNDQSVKCGSILEEEARSSLEDLPTTSGVPSSSAVGLTRAHRAPCWVATIVAARGVLYIRASSPKLPLLSYFPTHRLAPSFCTKISNVPL